ncbi:hypothetical protein [Actinoplanes sp. NPDC049265]|uniref:hypothetical protein n=1 Tax=Actinoplanes sp. NPDC049265 TaxID=3363902 RepID=UPI00371C5926
MAKRNANSGWSRGWSAFFAIVIILGGVAVSLGFGVRLRSALERNAENRMATASTSLELTVTEQLARYIDTVRLTAAALSSLDTPTARTFTDITTAVANQKLTATTGIRFVVPADPRSAGSVAPYWRDRGARDLKIGKVADIQEHLFTVFARGLNGATAPPLGTDQGLVPASVEVTRLARTANGVAVSDAYVQLGETKKAKADQQLSFDVVAPVAGADKRPAGYVMLSVSGTEFVTTLLARSAGDLLDAQLVTRSGGGQLIEVATVLHAGRAADVRRAQDFQAGQRQWLLRTSADRDVLLPTAGRTDMVIVLAGSILAVMFGTLMYLQMSATKRIEQEIEEEVEERLLAMDRL